MKKVGADWTSKALYFRENFVDEHTGKKKSKWVKVEGIFITDSGNTLEINTPLKEGYGSTNRVNWEKNTEKPVFYMGRTEYKKVR